MVEGDRALYAGFENSDEGVAVRAAERKRIQDALAVIRNPFHEHYVACSVRDVIVAEDPRKANVAFARFLELASHLTVPLGVEEALKLRPISRVCSFEDPAVLLRTDRLIYAGLRVLSAVCDESQIVFPCDKGKFMSASLFPNFAYYYASSVAFDRMAEGGFSLFHPDDACDAVARSVRVMVGACSWMPRLAPQCVLDLNRVIDRVSSCKASAGGVVPETMLLFLAEATLGQAGDLLALASQFSEKRAGAYCSSLEGLVQRVEPFAGARLAAPYGGAQLNNSPYKLG